MGTLRRFFLRLAQSLRPGHGEPDLAREVSSHLQLLQDDFERRGMSPDQARAAAARALGGAEHAKDLHRDARSFVWLDDVRRDVRYAARTLRQSPLFTAVAVLTLALGVGVNTAIFSAIDAVVLQRLPYADPDRLVMVWEDATAAGFPRNTPAPGNYSDWARLNTAFSGMAASASAIGGGNLTGGGEPEQVLGRRVTTNFFRVLGVQPAVGRAFTQEDDRSGAAVLILSYGLWQRRYGGDPGIVGRTLVMNDQQYSVVGVMPRSFVFRQNDIDFWVPLHFTPEQAASRASHYLTVIARLRPGVTIETARAEMQRISAVLQRQHPDTNGKARIGTAVLPLKNDLLGNTRLELFVLMGAAAAVLLIACANLMSLLLSRAIGRRSELAVRVALGATRARLIRQMLIEAMVLAMAGGLLALAIAPAGISLLAQMTPDGFPPSPASVLNARLLLFTFALAVLAGAAFSIIPAWQATRASGRHRRLHAARSVAGQESGRTRDALVVAQMAAALVLLIAAGLMLRTVASVRSLELGFRAEHLLTLRTALPRTRYADPARRLAFYDQVTSGVRALPGVEDAAYASTLPFTSIGNTTGYQLEGITLDPADPDDALFRIGTSDYLRTLGVTLVDGRLLDERDGASAPHAAVINHTMARKYWPRESAVGHRIRFDPEGPFYTIVGVIQDVRERGYTLDMKPAVYMTTAQTSEPISSLVVRVAGDPLAIAGAVRRVVAGVDPDEPVAAVRTMDDIVARDIRDRRQQMLLLSAFGGLALLLAVLGLYGVVSYSVASRTREFGVRLALGASHGSVIRNVVMRGVWLTAVGLGSGLAVAWAGSRALGSLLYGVTSTDPATFAGVVVVLGSTGLAAAYLPARRATRIELADVLRQQ